MSYGDNTPMEYGKPMPEQFGPKKHEKGFRKHQPKEQTYEKRSLTGVEKQAERKQKIANTPTPPDNAVPMHEGTQL
jgi:hypothetical protein